MVCSGKEWSKFTIFGANLIFFLFGVVIFGLGIWSVVKMKNLGEKPSAVDYIAIVVGVIMILSTFLGCCGAARESKCLLLMYVIVLILAVVLQCFVVYKSFTMDKSEIERHVRKDLEKKFTDHLKSFHAYEESMKCCGVDGFENYNVTKLPYSCCKTPLAKTECTTTPYCACPDSDIIRIGCVKELSNFLEKAKKPIGYTMIGVCVYELIMVILSGVIITYQKETIIGIARTF